MVALQAWRQDAGARSFEIPCVKFFAVYKALSHGPLAWASHWLWKELEEAYKPREGQ